MFIIPFNVKVSAGKSNVLALCNGGFSEDNLLIINRVQLSSKTPILAKLVGTTKDQLSGGTDISPSIINSVIGEDLVSHNLQVAVEPQLGMSLPIKSLFANGIVDLADDEDEIMLSSDVCIVLQVYSEEDVEIAGSIVCGIQKSLD